MRRRNRLAAIAGTAAAIIAALPFLNRLETFRTLSRSIQSNDLRRELESFPVPKEFRRIGILMAPLPVIEFVYASPLNGTPLCDRLFESASEIGQPKPWPGDPCGFSMMVPSGWPARLLNIWSYELRIFARPNSEVTSRPSDPICIRDRAEAPPLDSRIPPCWLEESESFVEFILLGDSTLP